MTDAVIENFKPKPELQTALKRLAEGPKEVMKLSPDLIIQLHDNYIKEYGGEYGIRDLNLFESVCTAPYQEYFGEVLYPTVFDKAAKYITDFANYQIFVDGNKRTGLVVAEVFLEFNGYTMNLTPEQYYNLTMDIAEHKIDETKIADFIKENALFYDGYSLGEEHEEYEYDI